MTETFESSKQLAVYIRKKYPRLKMYKDGRINLGDGEGTIRWTQFCPPMLWEMAEEISPELRKNKDLPEEIFTEIRDILQKEESRRMDASLDKYLPIIDFYDHSKRALINKDTGRPSLMDIETYKVLARSSVYYQLGVLVFDPYSDAIVETIELEGQEVNKINLYNKPPWQQRSGFLNNPTGLTMPTIVQEYMEHFIPNEECREFVLDWMHYCLTSRCETYLVLNGAKGAGKGAFYEAIMSPLMGKQYCNIAPESALESNFNSFLDGKRLVLLDEVKFTTPERVAKLKRYINEDQNIEKKGIDANKTVQTFNSFIVSNNNEDDCHIEWDDRRFSVIDITKTKLEDVWSSDKTDRLFALTDEEVEQLGNFIFYRKPQVMKDEFSYWRGQHFWHLCYVSLPEWAKVIVDMVTSKSQASYSVLDIRREYKRRTDNAKAFPRTNRIENFLRNYKHMGEHYLGETRGDPKDFEIVPSEAFRTQETKTNQEGFDSL